MSESELSVAETLLTLFTSYVPVATPIILNFYQNQPTKVTATQKNDPKKRKRKINTVLRPHQLIPFALNPSAQYKLAPNSDICYTYPKIITSSMVSHDLQTFKAAMLRICTSDVELVSEYEREQNPFGPNNRHFTGVNNVIMYFLTIMSASPDAMFEYMVPPRVYRDAATNKSFMSFKAVVSLTRTKILVDHINTLVTPIAPAVKHTKRVRVCRGEKKSVPTTPASPASVESYGLDQLFRQAKTVKASDTNTTTTCGNDLQHVTSSRKPGLPRSNSDLSLSSIDTNSSNDTTHSNNAQSSSSSSSEEEQDSPYSLASLTNSLQNMSFSAVPIKTPLAKTYNVGTYVYDIDENMKVTRICMLFYVTTDNPLPKGGYKGGVY